MRPRALSPAIAAYSTLGILVAAAAAVQEANGSGVARTAQAAPAHLTGRLSIDLPRGILTGDMCLSGLAVQSDSARFVLNRGLNVKRVRDASGAPQSFAISALPEDAGVVYAVRTPAPDRTSLCVEYIGAFPVYDVSAGDYHLWDGSSVIAFNGRNVRARGESRWYPNLFDATTRGINERISYSLRVECADCAQLYVSGAGHRSGPVAEFAAREPHGMVIFAGGYPVHRVAGTLFLGEDVHPDTATALVRLVGDIQRFYEQFVGVPYGPQPDVLRITPVRRDRRGQFWGFFSDPALGLVGLTIGDFVEILSDTAHAARAPVLGALAHELAHRYFPGPLGGPYGVLFGEPFANYLDLKATQHFFGEAAYQQRLRELQQRVIEGPHLPPLDSADPQILGTDAYRYGLAPLLLVTLEREMGEPLMRRVLNGVLTAPAAEQQQADYALLRRHALAAGVTEQAWRDWEARCVRPPAPGSACIALNQAR